MRGTSRRIARGCALALAIACLYAPAAAAQASSGALPAPWQGSPAWLHLEQGKRLYAQKDFGGALVEFDRAITSRRDSFAEARGLLAVALDAKTAKAASGSIAAALAAFAAEDFLAKDYRRLVEAAGGSSKRLYQALRAERISEGHRAFLGAMLAVLDYRPMEHFKDSLKTLGEEIDLLAFYPEAEFWKGRVFAVEGELALAERQYLRAFDMRASLEVPEERYAILYALADLYRTQDDAVAWENVMKRILSDDPVAGEPALDPFLRDAMMATLKDAGFDRFVVLYRIEPSFSFEANEAVAEFYLERGRAAASLHAAVAASMVVTRAVAMLRERDRDYAWTGLADFRARAAARVDISSYLAERGFNRLLLILADSLYAANARKEADYLWRSVAAAGEAPYAAVAARRLTEPTSAIRTLKP